MSHIGVLSALCTDAESSAVFKKVPCDFNKAASLQRLFNFEGDESVLIHANLRGLIRSFARGFVETKTLYLGLQGFQSSY